MLNKSKRWSFYIYTIDQSTWARARVGDPWPYVMALQLAICTTSADDAVTAHTPVSHFCLGTSIKGSADHVEACINVRISNLLI